MRFPITIAAASLVLAGSGCSGGGKNTNPATTATAPHRAAAHGAPDLEAMLPRAIDGTPLTTASTTGAAVLGGNAFGSVMTRFLAAHGKRRRDLRFATARSSPPARELELGVFQVRGLAGTTLLRAIVASSRPNAPGLTSSRATLSGKPVTRVVYPGGTRLYLYAHDGLVFYVGTQSEPTAAKVVAALP
jgi:hypothetical protein